MTYEVEDVNGRFTVVDKTITKNGAPATEIVFANLFTPETGYANLSATKTLVGRTLKADEFTFELVADNQVVQTKTNAANGAVVFDAIPLTAEGVYTYTIREVKGIDSAITYDNTVYTVEITVVQSGTKYIAESIKYFDGIAEVNGAAFENTYTAKATSAEITAEKELIGRNLNDGEFNFELYDEAGNLIQTKTNVGKAVAFDNVDLETAGTHKFTVKEKAGSLSGVTYDASEYVVTIIVTDDGNGQLGVTSKTITKNGSNAATIKFTNTYVAAATKGEIPVKKVLTGKTLETGMFGFVLKNLDTNTTVETMRNTASGEFVFDNIPFNAAGEYLFEVSELNENKTGYTYDDAVYTVKFVVVDDGNGQLEIDNTIITKGGATVTEVVFNNSYDALESVGETITGLKTIEGMDLVGDDFLFELRDANNNVLQTKANDIGGVFTFDALTFIEAGTYIYTVNEVVGDVDGMTWDASIFTVEIEVEDVNGQFTVVNKTVTKNGDSATLHFHNVYVKPITVPTAVSIPLNVQKIVENNTNKSIGLGHFEFKLVGDISATNMTATTNYKGQAKFELAFTEYNVGYSYSYELYETNTGISGMKYSEKVYDIRVDVTERNNTVVATFYVDGVETEYEDLIFEFTNVYGEGTPQKPTGGAATGGDNTVGLATAAAMLGGVIAVAAVLRRKTN